MTMQLYDLAGDDAALRFSPYCWRTKFALAHKQLAYETTPWRFTEEARLAFSGQAKVPVLVDGERTIADSWAIAGYLEERYPDRPSLFGGVAGQAHARFINAWADSILQPGIARLIVRDILDVLRPQDQPYFRHSRERAFGMKLEEVVKGRDQAVEEFRKLLAPLRLVLRGQPWLGGEAPDYADYIVLGSFMWPRCSSRFQLLDADDPVAEWRGRGLALFAGLGATARTV
jgi:glutathione S-transferase